MASITSTGSGDWDVGGTWVGGTSPAAGDRAIIANTHTVTLVQPEAAGDCVIQNGGTIIGGGNTLTLNSASGIDTLFSHAGDISVASDLHVTLIGITSNGDRAYLREGTATGDITNLVLNDSGATHTQSGDLNLLGTFTITAGTWDTSFGGNDSALTVAGDVSVTGTLTGNASAISCLNMDVNSGGTYNATSGTTTITDDDNGANGRCLYVHTDGFFNHNNGLMKFTNSSIPEIAVVGATLTKNPFYDVEVSGGKVYWANNPYILNNCKIKGVQFAGSTGFMHVEGICENSANDYNESDSSTSANHYFGTFVLSGGKLLTTAMEMTVGSLRNTGGTIE